MNLRTYKVPATAILALLSFSVFAKTSTPNAPKEAIAQSSFAFVENKGQIVDQDKAVRRDIDFRIATGGMNIFIGDGALHYQWSEIKGLKPRDLSDRHHGKGLMSAEGTETHIYRMDVELVGADIRAPFVAEGQRQYRELYYLPQCPGGLSANSFEKITYRNVYPNIDWVLYIEKQGPEGRAQSSLKYDFIVHPGGDPSDIKLRYKGATSLTLNNGALTAVTPMGSITEDRPYSYNAETRAEVSSSFILRDNILSFDIAPQAGTLVIDPQLHWTRHVGGLDTEYGLNVAVDPSGDGYVTGFTLSQSNFATWGSHQYLYGGFTQDGFLAKFEANGLVDWVTYYGGNGHDQVNDIACDHTGNVYFTGVTNSTDAITTPGAHQVTHSGGQAGYEREEAFLVKFNANGQRLWGTYYGSNREDISYALEVDRHGNVYMGGHTYSTGTDSIATTGAFRTLYSGGFLVKFNPTGVRLWGTYCGDSGYNYVSSIACDMKDNVYCGGSTTSYRNIATPGSHQPDNGGGLTGALGLEDGFLMKFNEHGQRLWATYYGGKDYDNVTAVACDDRGGVYIGGTTLSGNGTSIATAGTHRPTYNITAWEKDAFLAKFNEDGRRVWGTYYGRGRVAGASSPAWQDEMTRIKVLPNGSIFAIGVRYLNVPYLPYIAYHEWTQVFLTRLNQLGKETWFPDSFAHGITADLAYNDGKLYYGGCSLDTGQKATLNTVQQGAGDAFVARFFADTALYIPQPFGDSVFCLGDTMKIPFDVTNKFLPGNIVTLQLSDLSGNFNNGTSLTTVVTDTGGMLSYVIPNTILPGRGYRLRLIGTNPVDTSLDNNATIRISEYPNVGPVAIFPICANGTLQMTDTGTSPNTTTYKWTGPGGFSIATPQYNRPNVQSSDSGWYVLEGDNYGCLNRDSIFVQIYPKPAKPSFITNSPVCEGDTLKIRSRSTSLGVSAYNWAFYQGANPGPVWYLQETDGDTVIITPAITDSGRLAVVALAGGCPSDAETLAVVVKSKAAPTVQVGVNPGSYVGPWLSVTFSVTGSSNSGTAPTYQWSKNGTTIPGATASTYIGTTRLDLQTGDTICVVMTSSEVCATPATAKSCEGIEIDLGIDDINTTKGLELYPNPNNGKFILQSPGVFGGEEVRISNSLGQEVYRGILKPGTGKQEIDIEKMPRGAYLLHTSLKGKHINIKFVLTE